jgi:hypothetical protein
VGAARAMLAQACQRILAGERFAMLSLRLYSIAKELSLIRPLLKISVRTITLLVKVVQAPINQRDLDFWLRGDRKS